MQTLLCNLSFQRRRLLYLSHRWTKIEKMINVLTYCALQILRHTKRIVMHNTKMATVDQSSATIHWTNFSLVVSKALISHFSEVSKYYSLPFLNYEAAMQTFIESGGDQTLMWSSRSRHPLFSAHAFYADMVMYFCSLAASTDDL